MGGKPLRVVHFLKEYSALSVSCAAGVCVLVGALSADAYFKLFDIDFYSTASFSDYLKLGLNKLPSLFLAMLAALAVISMLYTLGNYPRNPRLFLNRFYKSNVNPVDETYIHQDFLNTQRIHTELFEKLKNSWWTLPVAIALIAYLGVIKRGSNGVYDEITSGKKGIVSVLFGKKGESLNCLSFIGEVGGFQHYWSLSSSEVISINKAAIKIIRKTDEFIPHVLLPMRPHPRSNQTTKDEWLKKAAIVKVENLVLRKAFIKTHCKAITL